MSPRSLFSRPNTLMQATLLAALCGLSGCYHVHVVIPNSVPSDYRGQWVNGFLWGAVGGSVDAGRLCGGRPVARVNTYRSFGNMFLSWLTLGIYTPSTVVVACAGPMGGYGMPGAGPYYAPPRQPAPPYYPQPQPQPAQPYYPQPQPQPAQPYYPQPPPQPQPQPAPPYYAPPQPQPQPQPGPYYNR